MWPGKKLSSPSDISQSRDSKGPEEVGRSVPKTGEADVDEEVGTAAGDEEDTNRWDCGSRIISALETTRPRVLRGGKGRRRRRALRKMVIMTTRTAETGLGISVIV